jgi:oxaloacetate decarboxylase alpha subunit
MKRYRITVDGRTYDVHLLSDPHQEQVEVEVNGKPLLVGIQALPAGAADLAPAAAPSARPQTVAPAATTVRAPLPGLVKSVAVRPDQQVATGDVLLVIEAMKMDNVIRAPRAGTIHLVHVREGQQIGHGEPIVEYQE